ncbi:glutamyl-tRNA reductase [Polynucleobacter paneuropaeus]|uniref:Glutamyl-tRNA reductase n=1 Tax=Polynucleobacter paneuropaeus TaxID=2527775 RepID=A0A2Z4JR73_9BURK|nr:glutamyl-tRNA reductase [Polynucleobacter paneuropaeus]AWW49260.1 glutamyl-tRNA reductase [Polynucleobacter paneuropaeus]MBT8562904.1 glutamyl-tRNA reductase [Polynucleobacter paneuropaeus]QWD06990.1 glutamyl-tRNA reductase [Polynucleobacter paneuropaeus]QWD21037.1 glutamyl-tRNA reductase [Polynucleobacter paneuropaeus]QWD22807.1 glutamyl-tRNA reductase [Polynucleobacter paneuropaeus]
MQILNLGVNHHTAPIDIRERVAIAPEHLQDSLLDLRNHLKGKYSDLTPEVTILSTCNRMEIYCAANDATYPDHYLEERTFDWLAAQNNVHQHELRPYIYSAKESDAVKHAFRVGSGLDSMVLGETQILGQMKKAIENANQVGALGAYLKPLFDKTFSVAKVVRGNTQIGAHSVSMAGASVKLVERIFGKMSQCSVLFIGAGEMIGLCANHFAGKNPKKIAISNRTVDRGNDLIKTFSDKNLQTEVFPLVDLPKQLHEYDVVVSCTASSLPIIGMGMVKTALKARQSRPIVLIDLAVPRDFEPEIKSLKNAYLYSIDDLGEIVSAGKANRQDCIGDAEKIIERGVIEFYETLEKRAVVPIIKSIQNVGEQYQKIELEKASRRIANGDDPMVVLSHMAIALANKFMHAPIHALKQSSDANLEEYKQIISKIYSSK